MIIQKMPLDFNLAVVLYRFKQYVYTPLVKPNTYDILCENQQKMKAVETMQHIFRDYYRNEVTLSFADHPFSEKPKHVWVICYYHDKWLLTRHKERGLEFPGGKVEKNESARDAAIREVKEETGGTVAFIRYIGQYIVAGKTETIVKNIYFAEVGELASQETYFETEGPFVLARLPRNVKSDKRYSFIMKDDVLTHAIAFIEREGWRNRP